MGVKKIIRKQIEMTLVIKEIIERLINKENKNVLGLCEYESEPGDFYIEFVANRKFIEPYISSLRKYHQIN